ncbi:hypothetical protein, partial [Bartonella rochalimae]|uniref:hypothetical protein n=1 Tax=Bartonella rochalimae TaxID=395923 RepID=UPI001AEC2A26
MSAPSYDCSASYPLDNHYRDYNWLPHHLSSPPASTFFTVFTHPSLEKRNTQRNYGSNKALLLLDQKPHYLSSPPASTFF